MEDDERPRLSTNQKALKINLDPVFYGTFAEIGAGQEVARWFFKVGAAAGTISKSISAYDMAVSDAIYGRCKRYVSRERLQGMLDYEHGLNLERLRIVARRQHRLLRLRQHRRGSQLSRHERVPRLDGRQISGSPAGRRQPDHYPCPNARSRKRPSAGDSGHRRSQSALRRFFPASQAGSCCSNRCSTTSPRSASRST